MMTLALPLQKSPGIRMMYLLSHLAAPLFRQNELFFTDTLACVMWMRCLTALLQPTSSHCTPSAVRPKQPTPGMCVAMRRASACRAAVQMRSRLARFSAIRPFRHPGGMLDLDGMMIEVSQDVEHLPLVFRPHDLMTRRL